MSQSLKFCFLAIVFVSSLAHANCLWHLKSVQYSVMQGERGPVWLAYHPNRVGPVASLSLEERADAFYIQHFRVKEDWPDPTFLGVEILSKSLGERRQIRISKFVDFEDSREDKPAISVLAQALSSLGYRYSTDSSTSYRRDFVVETPD